MVTSSAGGRLPRASGRCCASSSCPCRAARPSSTPRTPPRSSRWPTSSRAPRRRGGRRLRRPDLLPAARGRSEGRCRRTSGARSSPTSPGATSTQFFGGTHPAWRLTVGDLAERPRRVGRAGRPDRSWTCSRRGTACDAVADALRPGGILCAYVATTTQLSPLRRDGARARRLHRAGGLGVAGPRTGTSRAWPSGRATR